MKAEEQREEQEAIKSFVQGAIQGDFELFDSGIDVVEEHCGWRRAFLALAGVSVPIELRTHFAKYWVHHGERIRKETNDDLALIAGLWALLPPYTGGPLRLYRGTVRSFVAAVKAGDLERFDSLVEPLDLSLLWRQAFKALKSVSAPPRLRKHFQPLWISHGDHLRGETDNDLTLIVGLRALLPPYKGPPLRLYRGESMFNRRHRTYGISWTTDIEIARGYALDACRMGCEDGAVVITTLAPTAAIISKPGRSIDHYGEREVLVNRRQLEKVDVLNRYSAAEGKRLLAEQIAKLPPQHPLKHVKIMSESDYPKEYGEPEILGFDEEDIGIVEG